MRVLLIDDELLYYKLISPELKKAGYELKYARTGKKGLEAIRSYDPDMLIIDLRLPDIDGFEIMQRLRSDLDYSQIPVIFITTQNTLDDKLKAFDLGVDDYLVKPFPPEELVARLGILARRGKIMKIVQEMDEDHSTASTSIAIHSLRGGVGSSSLALNLALAFQQIWGKDTLLVDGVFAAGQIAMMLNVNPRSNWESLIGISEDELDDEMIAELVSQKEESINYIAAPRNPIATDTFTPEFWKKTLAKIKGHSDFLVFDTAHDFSDGTISILAEVETILLIVTPDMASLRATVSTLEVYDQLGFAPDQILLVLNYNTNITGIKQAQLEKVFEREFDYVIPHEPKEVFRAINFGEPFILANPKLPISIAIEDMAYDLSHSSYKNIPPASPSSAWKRVTERKK
jgi:pilus assembly protein CpaE